MQGGSLTRRLTKGALVCALGLGIAIPAAGGRALAAEEAGVFFEGTPPEWDVVAHDAVSVGNDMQELKALQKDGKLYLYAKGAGLAQGGTFSIDSDNDLSTGGASGLWADSGGIDYELRGGELYRYDEGDWTDAGAAAVSAQETFVEAEIDLAALGVATSHNIKVGFRRDGVQALPELGSLMLTVAPTTSAGGGGQAIAVDGDPSDWAGIDALMQSADGSTTVKAYIDAGQLYVLIEGQIDAGEFADGLWEHILIDTDKNPATGAATWAWPSKLGSEYLVQLGSLFASGADGGWTWNDTGTSFPYERSGTGANKVIEWSLPLEDLNLGSASSIRLGFLSNTETAPDAAGDPATLTLTEAGGGIAIDGQDADWAEVELGAAPSGAAPTELYAVQDDRRLYTLVKGRNLDLRNVYYIDSDNDGATGYASELWPGAGADYKVDRGALYRYSSDGSGAWAEVGPAYTNVTAETAEMSVYLDQLGRTAPGEMRIGYAGRDVLLLPEAGQPMLDATHTIASPHEADTFYPRESFDVLNNPYMGWTPLARDANKPAGEAYAQPHSLVYAGISWRELEPERGQFDWEGVEQKYQFDYWASRGVKINLRIVLDLPTTDPTHKDIPDWLYDELAAEGDPGTWYDTAEIGAGFSPNYNSATLLAEHDRMLAAVAARYNDDPRVAFIELGSLGHWGEWHTWPAGSGVFPTLSVSDAYVSQYIEHFTEKKLGMRKPFPIAKDHDFGLFNDVFGIKSSTNEFLGWTQNGWTDIGQSVDPGDDPAEKVEASKMPDFWQRSYSGGEFADGDAVKWLTDDAIMESLRQARDSHTSWLGPSSPADVPADSPLQPNLDAMLKTMGYRFVLESVKHDGQVRQGDALGVSMIWNNKGVAPFYFDWPLRLALADAQGNVAATADAEGVDIRGWLPGRTPVDAGFDVPPTLPPGTYTLLAALIDPATGQPGIQLAIDGQREDGYYALDTVTVTAGSGNGGNTDNGGNNGNAGNSGNGGNAGNNGNTGNGGNTGNSGNTGNTGSSGNTGNADSAGSSDGGNASGNAEGSVTIAVEPSVAAGADGTAQTVFAVDGDALAEAAASLNGSDGGAGQRIRIPVRLDSEGTAKVIVPAAALAEAAAAAPGAVIAVEADEAGYRLPVDLLPLDSLARELGVDPADMKVGIAIRKLAGEEAQDVANAAAAAGMELQGSPFAFAVTAEANGQTLELTDFGRTYVVRTISLPGNSGGEDWTAVRYDTETKRFSFAPALFSAANGTVTAAIKRNGDSVYAVVRMARTFADTERHWARGEIARLASKGLLNGVTADDFDPDGALTRAEFAAMLSRALGLSPDPAAVAAYDDANPDAWYAGEAGAAVRAGLTTGISPGVLAPDRAITREQMATMLSEALAFTGVAAQTDDIAAELSSFADAGEIGRQARGSVAACLRSGVMQGTADGLFSPLRQATRAEAAVALERLLEAAGLMDPSEG